MLAGGAPGLRQKKSFHGNVVVHNMVDLDVALSRLALTTINRAAAISIG
jgi:hypothetical protein